MQCVGKLCDVGQDALLFSCLLVDVALMLPSPLAVLVTKAEFAMKFQTFIAFTADYLWEHSIPTSLLHS